MARPERAQARRAEMVVGDHLQDFGGSKPPHSAFAGEGKMLIFKSFDDAGRAWVKGFRSWSGRVWTGVLRGVDLGDNFYSIDSHV